MIGIMLLLLFVTASGAAMVAASRGVLGGQHMFSAIPLSHIRAFPAITSSALTLRGGQGGKLMYSS